MTVWDRWLDPLLHEVPWHRVIDGPVLELERDTPTIIADYPRASTPEEDYLFLSLLNVDRVSLGPYDREIYERYASACYNLALYFSESGDPRRAVHFASLCLQFKPDYSPPGQHLISPKDLMAYNLYKAGDLDLAREKLEELAESDPNNSIYHVYLAEVYIAKNDKESAKREIKIALRLEPDNPMIVELYRKLFGQ
jgi:tetratricopeptide (TPR) repeat protein